MRTSTEIHALLDEAAEDAKARGLEFIGEINVYAYQEDMRTVKIGMTYGDVSAWRRIPIGKLELAIAPRSLLKTEWADILERLKAVAPLAELETDFATRH